MIWYAWLIAWLIDWMVDWLIDWLTAWFDLIRLIDQSTNWLVGMFGSMHCTPYGSTIKCIEDLWSHRAMFGSMHCTLWVHHQMYWKSMEPSWHVWIHALYPYASTIKCIEDLWSQRAMFGSMHCTPIVWQRFLYFYY